MKIVDEPLLDEFRQPGRCDWCKRWFHVREPHHLSAKGMGSGKRLDVRINLISLCRTCHQEFHDGNILRVSLLLMVADREGALQPDIEAVMWLLRRLPKGASEAQIEREMAALSIASRALAERTLETFLKGR